MKHQRMSQSCTALLLASIVAALFVQAAHSVTTTGGKETKCKPTEVHLSYGESASEMVILWSTEDLCNPAKVKYNLGSPWNLNKEFPGESRVFTYSAGLKKKNMHLVKMRNLQPDSTYFYKPSSFGVLSASTYMFKTPPAASSEGTDELHFMVVSDVSSTSPAISVINNEASSGKYAAILHAGNIAMNLSSSSGQVGTTYFEKLEQCMGAVPYMVSPGPDEQENGEYAQYMHRFAMPTGAWPMTRDRLWYSVDIGNVHLISLSMEVFFTNGGEFQALQHDWLIRDLKHANLNREKVPWVVVFTHRPMYCSYEDPSLHCNQKASSSNQGMDKLETILYRLGADIVIQSYGAAYERSYPQFKGVPVTDNYTDPLGPVHVIAGGASPWELKYNFTEKAPKWCAFRFTNRSATSYGHLHIINSSHAEYQQIDVESKEVLDTFTIVQSKHGQFSIEDLPANVSANIDQHIKEAGGKPGVLNIDEIGKTPKADDMQTRIQQLIHGDNRNRLIIGIVGGIVALLAVVVIVAMRRCRKRRRTTRRWEQMDINYGKKFYSKAPDKDEDNDFEIDMSDGTEGTRQLLSE